MKSQALDIALIGRLNQEPLQQERAPREAQTQAIPAGSKNRGELSRRALPKLRGASRVALTMRKGREMKGSSLKSRPGSLVCPVCEAAQLRPFGHHSVRCESCRGIVSGVMLEALRQITALPDALGNHACECGHPEMRLLPDGTQHCPSCGSEVVALAAQATMSEPNGHSEAYWSGWADGRFGERGSFVDNPSLGKWEDPSERLAYYRGHRAGSEARRISSSSSNSDAREKLFG